MKLLDGVGFAITALARHRLRSSLSTLGVAIGVAAVVLLTSLGEGARRYVDDQFRSLGTNLLIVIPGHTDTAGGMPGIGGTPNDLTLKDAEEVRRSVRQAELVVPISLGSETVSNRERRKQVYVVGGTDDFIAVRKLSQREVCAPTFDRDLAALFRAGAPLMRFLCESADVSF